MGRSRTQERSRSGRVALVGLGLCLGTWASGAAWAAGPIASRRSAATAGMIAVLGGAAAGPARAEFRPGTASEPGVNEEAFDYEAKDAAEVVEKRKQARDAAAKREQEETIKFRQLFTDFSKDDISAQQRADYLEKMKNQVIEDKRLPLGITRDDLVKGVRAVKFNIGCIKDKPKKDADCKIVEKAYIKLLAGIDKLSNPTLLSAR